RKTCGLFRRNPLERVNDSEHGPEQADEGSRRTDRRQARDAALQLSMHDRRRPLQGPLGRFNFFTGYFGRDLMGLKFLQARRHHLRQVAPFILLRNFDGLPDVAVLESARHGGSKDPRLLSSSLVSDPTVDHHTDGPCRHDQKHDHDKASGPAHPAPHAHEVKRGGFFTLKQKQAQRYHFRPDHHDGMFPPSGFSRIRRLLGQRVVHVNLRHNFNRVAVEQRRLIAPALHSFEGRLDQKRVALDHFQVLDRPVLADNRFQAHRSLDASHLGQRWVFGLGLEDQLGGFHLPAHANALGSRRFGWRRRWRSVAANDAAQHSAGAAPGHATRYAAHDASGGLGRRLRLVLNLPYGLRNNGRRLHNVLHRHAVYRDFRRRCGWGRGGRRRGRRRGQGDHQARFGQAFNDQQRVQDQTAYQDDLENVGDGNRRPLPVTGLGRGVEQI